MSKEAPNQDQRAVSKWAHLAARPDPNDRFLRLLFLRTVRGVLGTAAVGCVQADHVPAPDAWGVADEAGDRSWRSRSCESDRWALASHIRTSKPFDYVSLRYTDTDEGETETNVSSERGTVCERAQDDAACLREVAEASVSVQDDYLWVTTTGESVETWAGSDGRRELFGTIDTRDEALFEAEESYPNPFGCYEPELARARPVSGGYEVEFIDPDSGCPEMTATRRRLFVSSEGEVELLDEETIPSDTCWIDGRRPPGLCESRRMGGRGALARHFSRAAHFEAASVHSFRVLARELTALGAPVSLVRRARLAARDEVRHARAMGRLAKRFGGAYPPPSITQQPLRSLLDIALDNAVEGCVNETFAALVATYQASATPDPEIRRAMAQVAADETRHAALSWHLARWAGARLDARGRMKVQQARRAALEKLRVGLEKEPARSLQHVAGIPSAAAARRLLADLDASLFASA